MLNKTTRTISMNVVTCRHNLNNFLTEIHQHTMKRFVVFGDEFRVGGDLRRFPHAAVGAAAGRNPGEGRGWTAAESPEREGLRSPVR